MKIKAKVADTWFSRCVRAANNWTCERCGNVYDSSSTGLHCSHIYSRRHRTIRWCKANAQALCYSCHTWFGGNPIESGAWVEKIIGNGTNDILTEKRHLRVKISKLEEKEIAAHYKAEYNKILVERESTGRTDYIDFTSYQ